MRRFLFLLALAAVAGGLAIGERAAGQPGEEFGVLRTTPAAAPTATPSPAPSPASLPAGIEPARPTGAAANPFPLSAEAGAWMICAATYLGPDGAELARQLAVDLRTRHQLPAYIFNRGDEERRKQTEEWEAMKKRYPGVPLRKRTYRIQDQYAILVGGWPDFAAASAYLPKIKALPLPELKLDGGKSPYDEMTYQEPDPDKKTTVVKRARINPYTTAMVVRNPQVPAAANNRPKWDPFWKQLNAHEEFSLLRNPKPWTLVVREYMGARTLQQQQKSENGFLAALGLGGARPGEALDAAAQQAHELARFLRQPQFGLESWVLHTRYSSVVCVGGFTGPEDPELQRLQRQIAALKFSAQQGGGDPIGLMPTPMPIEVPRP